jgi:P27 family predicted phage terminase small subunit
MTARRPPRRPSPPASLSTRAREEWRRLAPIAHQAGTLTARSAKAFEILVEVLATERQARELVATDGITVKTGRDGVKPHPAVRTMETARAHAAVLMRQFRLEPPKVAAAPPSKLKGKSTWQNVLK